MEYKYVSFDIADQSFKFYTALEWHNLIANAREELQEDHDMLAEGDVEEEWKACFADVLVSLGETLCSTTLSATHFAHHRFATESPSLKCTPWATWGSACLCIQERF